MESRVSSFAAAAAGQWKIVSVRTISGAGLAPASHLWIGAESGLPAAPAWVLRGSGSNLRYTTEQEVAGLTAVQEGLGRPAASAGALIPIRKSDAWWSLAQDRRRAIFEEQSRHIRIGLAYLPPIARKLFHARDLGEPFDFLTWFEFAPADAPAFDRLLAELRQTEEWRYVDREVEIRVERA